LALAKAFTQSPNAEVAYICDVDKRAIDKGIAMVQRNQKGANPKGAADFRTALNDKNVDALVVATPNHWHAPATILACKAGKHVYVEKPCSHNPGEGELMVKSAAKYKRVVQMGNQRRSWVQIQAAIKMIHNGVLGKVFYSRGWYANTRTSIGIGKKVKVPAWLNFNEWQGPATRKPYKDNLVHYKWHWHWHWGNGEIGNNGIHAIDLCRWGLQVDYPTRVTSVGGRYRYVDDQETPDTHVVSYDFPGKKSIMWEGLSCNRRGPEGNGFGASFHGEKGTIVIDGAGYSHYSATNRLQDKVPGAGGDMIHIEDFISSIRTVGNNGPTRKSNSEIDGAVKSTLLCHLGNIAHRTGRTLNCDPKNGRILNDKDAMKLWSREYEKGWTPKL